MSRLVRRVFDSVESLKRYPRPGKRPPELSGTQYREVIVSPCRIFYRVERQTVYIVHVMRSEQLLRAYLLDAREEPS